MRPPGNFVLSGLTLKPVLSKTQKDAITATGEQLGKYFDKQGGVLVFHGCSVCSGDFDEHMQLFLTGLAKTSKSVKVYGRTSGGAAGSNEGWVEYSLDAKGKLSKRNVENHYEVQSMGTVKGFLGLYLEPGGDKKELKKMSVGAACKDAFNELTKEK